MNLDKLKASIKRHEGFKSQRYLDTVGKWTIGFGRNLDDLPLTQAERDHLDLHDDRPITEEEAWYLVEGPLNEAIADASKLTVRWKVMGDPRQNTLVELVYNIGYPRASKFKKMRAALDNGDYVGAALELLDSKWKVDVGPGRASRMANQLSSGEWA